MENVTGMHVLSDTKARENQEKSAWLLGTCPFGVAFIESVREHEEQP